MALPAVHKKPTPKRVAAYLVDAMIGVGLNSEIDAMEAAFDVQLTGLQRKDVVRHFEKFRHRILTSVGRLPRS